MADLDLTALRVRLAELPGFDPVGLWLTDAEGKHEHLVLHDDERDVLVHSGGSDDMPWWWTKDQEHAPLTDPSAEPHLSAADDRTADALARWAYARVAPGEQPPDTAPTFTFAPADYEDGPDGVVCWLNDICVGASTPEAAAYWDSPHIPALATVPHPGVDHRTVPSGASFGGRMALAIIARHLGGTVGPKPVRVPRAEADRG